MDFEYLLKNAQEDYCCSKKKSNMYSFLRFFSMLCVLLCLFGGYFQKRNEYYYIAFLIVCLFVIVVFRHNCIKKQLEYKKSLEIVYQRHLQRKNNQWNQFEEDGNEFQEECYSFAKDLDLFGKNSLYQMINIAKSSKGCKLLACSLYKFESLQNIYKRQQAVQELASQPQFVVELEVLLQNVSNSFEPKELFVSEGKTSIKFIMGLALLAIISLFAMVFRLGLPYTQIIFEISFVLQLSIALIRNRKSKVIFDPIINYEKSLKGFYKVFECIYNKTFQSELNKGIYSSLFEKNNVLKGLKSLNFISQVVLCRNNIFVFILLNGLFSYDLIALVLYRKWVHQYQKDSELWFDNLALLETLASLSVICVDEFDVCMPEIVDKQGLLNFEKMKHPLIFQSKAVPNDFQCEKNVNIITGSNMSGKTTFMRTVALNLVLAYAGGYVFAKKLQCSHMRILTSMRVSDNVEEGISTFYGELLRIKEMIAISNKHEPMICFIDEIFKGTNSLDRIAGAKATIQKLSIPYCLLFLTTHDFELTKINDDLLGNYHFEEFYTNEHIYFDYKIKKGPSTTTNGQFLLQQLGILDKKVA